MRNYEDTLYAMAKTAGYNHQADIDKLLNQMCANIETEIKRDLTHAERDAIIEGFWNGLC